MRTGKITTQGYLEGDEICSGQKDESVKLTAPSSSINADLDQVIVKPECPPSIAIADITFQKEGSVSPRSKNMSSAYNMMFSSMAPHLKPIRLSLDLINAANDSMARANNKGESGQPCGKIIT